MDVLGKYFGLMRWWLRRWYPVFRWFGRVTGQEDYIERAIEVTEDNFAQILGGDDE